MDETSPAVGAAQTIARVLEGMISTAAEDRELTFLAEVLAIALDEAKARIEDPSPPP